MTSIAVLPPPTLQLLVRRVVELPDPILDVLELRTVVVVALVEVDCAHFLYLLVISLTSFTKSVIRRFGQGGGEGGTDRCSSAIRQLDHRSIGSVRVYN